MDAQYERYQRQILLKEFGEAGQQKLGQSKVLVIGAGGLGCPALQYLAAAGVGTIGIIDDDMVSLHNLHRQILYSTDDIGSSKAESAAFKLQQLNPDIHINAYNKRLTNQNALDFITTYDIVIDGTDNFASRYMINDACVLLNKPLVYGAISKFEGQVTIFNCKKGSNERPVNYRDLFPNPPAENEILNCAEAGVLGILPGIIGTMQANETIKLIAHIGEPLINRLLTYNALTNQVYELEITPSEETLSLIPKDEIAFKNRDYDWLCSSKNSFDIDTAKFDTLIQDENTIIIDAREYGEMPVVTEFPHLHIPLKQLAEKASSLEKNTIVTFCQSGSRSLQAAQMLFDTFGDTKNIYSLQGGIIQWKQRHIKS